MFYRVIVIDAGHGGKDSGATGNGYIEKNMTLKIVQNIKTNFDSDPLYKVYYTRLSDWYPTLTERYDLANAVNADRFLSVHINSADSASAKGTETLYKDYKTYASVIHSSSLSGMGYTKGLLMTEALYTVLDLQYFEEQNDECPCRDGIHL